MTEYVQIVNCFSVTNDNVYPVMQLIVQPFIDWNGRSYFNQWNLKLSGVIANKCEVFSPETTSIIVAIKDQDSKVAPKYMYFDGKEEGLHYTLQGEFGGMLLPHYISMHPIGSSVV